MFSIEMTDITNNLLDRVMLLTLFFPSLLFWGGLLAVYLSVNGFETTVNDWSQQGVIILLLQIVAALAWLVFFAHLLGSKLVWMTRQFEGYWEWPLGGKLQEWRRAYYQKVLAEIDLDTEYQKIYYGFPFPDEPEEVMPTRLGNILKNAELYPAQRYDIDAVVMWPRLYPLLPDAFARLLGSARGSLELMLVISSLSMLFAVVASAYLWVTGGSWQLFLACSLGGFLVAYLAYLSALEAALSYGALLKSAFDLYKGDLLQKMGYQSPNSLQEERTLWTKLHELVYRGEAGSPDVLAYAAANSEQNEQLVSEQQPAVLLINDAS